MNDELKNSMQGIVQALKDLKPGPSDQSHGNKTPSNQPDQPQGNKDYQNILKRFDTLPPGQAHLPKDWTDEQQISQQTGSAENDVINQETQNSNEINDPDQRLYMKLENKIKINKDKLRQQQLELDKLKETINKIMTQNTPTPNNQQSDRPTYSQMAAPQDDNTNGYGW